MTHVFRTIVRPSPNPSPLGLGSPVLSLGSCFALVIGERLRRRHFNIEMNPFGTLYNPISIARTLERILDGAPYRSEELFHHDGRWGSFDHDTSFDADDAGSCLARINARLRDAHAWSKRLETLIVTLGTSFAWSLNDQNRVVANCHKLPAGMFTRRLLAIDDMVEAWSGLLTRLYRTMPDLSVIVSVSPVRHLRNDPHENSVAKAHLLAALHQLQQQFPSLYYFPSYEIVLDELRDYRFYARDYVHVSEEAEEYVWERFVEACVDDDARSFVRMYEPIGKAAAHCTVRPHDPAARTFASAQLERIRSLEERYQGVRLNEERAHFERVIDAAQADARDARGGTSP